MQVSDILQSLFRWLHVVAGILWIGLLYFFNFVNSAFAPTLDADAKKKVVPELMPRALYWFRWGAAFTWISGVLLMLLIFYHGGALFDDPSRGWSPAAFVMIAIVFIAPFIYDILLKTVGKANMKAAVVVGFLLIAATIYLFGHWAGFGYRGYVIHTGAMLGTIMAFNVWFRIWPAQKQIITAVKNGTAPDPALVAMAGLRSKQNTYLSVPLVWTMLNSHNTWSSGSIFYLLGAILLGWFVTGHLYKKAAKVKGF